jgi:two-component system, chemotaxis family, response regulator WspF
MKLGIAHRDRLTRDALRRSLRGGSLELLWNVEDYDSLRQRCGRETPSLALVDIGLLGPRAERLPALLQRCPVVICAESSAADGAYEALGLGALGLIEPPRLDDSGELHGGSRVRQRIERLAGLLRAEASSLPPLPPAAEQPLPLIAIGASTGGPLALSRLLRSLPAALPAAVLVVQHIEGEFTAGLVDWLRSHCTLPIGLAERGDSPRPGHIYVAAPGQHLVLLPSLQFGWRAATPRELHVPAVDALFLSLAQSGCHGAAALLTGMGHDGVDGLLALRRQGWTTIAQDEASSVVWGMPRAAVERQAAEQVLPLEAIGPALVRAASARRGARP